MPPALDDCPYVGLQPFTEQQTAYFFGREREIKIISANLFASHLTILYGPSGAGKSSVLRAGVLPHVAKSARTAVVYFSRWQDETFLSTLKERLVSAVEAAAGRPLQIDQGGSLDDVLRAVSEAFGGTILLIFDQFEEYLVYHPESRDGGFEAEFASAINSDDIDVSFLISLREDWLANLQRFDVRIPNFFGNQLRVRALNRSAAADALRKPLEVYNTRSAHPVVIEDDLVENIIDEASVTAIASDSGGAGQTPSNEETDTVQPSLLQLVMVRLWREQADSQSLTLAAFRALGGVKRISEQHLTSVLDQLSDEERKIADECFRYLVMPQGNKIAQTTENLVSVAGHGEEAVRRTLAKLSDARILSRTYPPERYEITHDVLCPAVLDWRRQRAREEALRRAEQEARAARRFRRLSVALGVMFAAAAVAAVIAWSQWMRSWSRELSAAAVTQLGADPEMSIVLALEALWKWHTPEAETALHRALMTSRVRATLEGHTGPVRKAAFSPDGKLVATGGMDGSVRLWEAGSGKLVRSIAGANPGGVLAVAFAPDGCCVASAGMENVAVVWRVASGEKLMTLAGHTQPVTDVAFSAGAIATASQDGSVRLWNAQDGSPAGVLRAEGGDAQVNAVDISRDGLLLAGGDSQGKVYIWPTGTKRLRTSFVLPFAVQDVAFSPNGRVLAVASARTVWLWDLHSPPKLFEQSAHAGTIYSLAFSADGKHLATSSQDGTVRVWSAQTNAQDMILAGHRGGVRSVSFSPHEAVVSASEDGTARVWTTGPVGEDLAVAVGTDLPSVAFSPRGDALVTAGPQANAAVVWDARTGARLRTLSGHTADVLDARFSANGEWIATASADETVRLWSASTGEELKSFSAGGWVQTVAFDPTNTWVAIGGYSHTFLWDLRTATPTELQPQPADRVNKVAFSPDGQYAGAASTDGSVTIWSVRTRALQARFSEHRNFSSLAFLSGGHTVVAGAEDGTLRAWDFERKRIERTLAAHSGPVHAISDGGTQIATGGADGLIYLWDAGSSKKLLTLMPQGGEVRDVAFSPDRSQLASASSDGAVRIFHLDLRTLPDFALTRITREELRRRVREHRSRF